ncbi:MAG TPA: SGNH/GDSL hydrolase family protein [Thermoanaerobaculia bacterium]|jgi:lysophospholipase L1-like esterase|nr:SGNH/GDSL hydrolase family protein [Thermoanaerobaculia bacterium]
MKSFSRLAAVVVLALLIAAPSFAARGRADFTVFVAIGDSYGAGFENGSLNANHQPFSWPAIIARQAGVKDFQQPLVSFPGIGNELQLVDVISYPPVILPAPGAAGQPTNLNLARPYNNLSVVGATVTDVITLKGNEQNPTTTAARFAQFVLRGLGTEVEQAIAQHPTFIAIWIGGNDLLGAALAGTPRGLTPTDTFRASYTRMLDALVAGAPDAGIVVGNLPANAAALPILSTLPPVLINPQTRLPVLLPNGQPIFFIADLGGGTIGQLTTGSAVLLPCSSAIATGFGIPEALKADPRFASLPNIGKPLPDACVLTTAEIAQFVARAAEYNQVISDAASSRNIPVADIKGLFDRFPAGVQIGPFTFSSAYITGGIFSLDGFHLTDLGYTLFANQYIRTINQAYGTHIPVAPITTLLANNGAFFPEQQMRSGNVFMEGMEWTISDEAAAIMLRFASPVPSRRLHAASH